MAFDKQYRIKYSQPINAQLLSLDMQLDKQCILMGVLFANLA